MRHTQPLPSPRAHANPRAPLPAVVENLRDLGCDVKTYKWDSSEHVKHIVEHADEYARLVLDFIGKLGLPRLDGGPDGCGQEDSQAAAGTATNVGVSASSAAGQSQQQQRQRHQRQQQRVPSIIEAPSARL